MLSSQTHPSVSSHPRVHRSSSSAPLMVMLRPPHSSSCSYRAPSPASCSIDNTPPMPAPRWWAGCKVSVSPPEKGLPLLPPPPCSWLSAAVEVVVVSHPVCFLHPQQHLLVLRGPGPRISAPPSFHYLSAGGRTRKTGRSVGGEAPEASRTFLTASPQAAGAAVVATIAGDASPIICGCVFSVTEPRTACVCSVCVCVSVRARDHNTSSQTHSITWSLSCIYILLLIIWLVSETTLNM